jgi:hypothetical protein
VSIKPTPGRDTFSPDTDTPTTVEEAVAFWKHWGMKPWFHPDDRYEAQAFDDAVAAAWELKNPWDDDMTPFWDERSREMYAAMGMPYPDDEVSA